MLESITTSCFKQINFLKFVGLCLNIRIFMTAYDKKMTRNVEMM